MRQHVGFMLPHHYYPLAIHPSHLICDMFAGFASDDVAGERVGYGHSSLVVVEPALGWPIYGLFPGCSVAAVGGRAVVVVV